MWWLWLFLRSVGVAHRSSQPREDNACFRCCYRAVHQFQPSVSPAGLVRTPALPADFQEMVKECEAEHQRILWTVPRSTGPRWRDHADTSLSHKHCSACCGEAHHSLRGMTDQCVAAGSAVRTPAPLPLPEIPLDIMNCLGNPVSHTEPGTWNSWSLVLPLSFSILLV